MKRIYLVFILPVLLLSAVRCGESVKVVQHEPVIESITASRTLVYPKEFVTIVAKVTDKDKNDKLDFKWTATGGKLTNENNNPTQWHAPDSPGTFTITLSVFDGVFEVKDSIEIKVIAR